MVFDLKKQILKNSINFKNLNLKISEGNIIQNGNLKLIKNSYEFPISLNYKADFLRNIQTQNFSEAFTFPFNPIIHFFQFFQVHFPKNFLFIINFPRQSFKNYLDALFFPNGGFIISSFQIFSQLLSFSFTNNSFFFCFLFHFIAHNQKNHIRFCVISHFFYPFSNIFNAISIGHIKNYYSTNDLPIMT